MDSSKRAIPTSTRPWPTGTSPNHPCASHRGQGRRAAARAPGPGEQLLLSDRVGLRRSLDGEHPPVFGRIVIGLLEQAAAARLVRPSSPPGRRDVPVQPAEDAGRPGLVEGVALLPVGGKHLLVAAERSRVVDLAVLRLSPRVDVGSLSVTPESSILRSGSGQGGFNRDRGASAGRWPPRQGYTKQPREVASR